jgi:hypothetical protein
MRDGTARVSSRVKTTGSFAGFLRQHYILKLVDVEILIEDFSAVVHVPAGHPKRHEKEVFAAAEGKSAE